MDRTTTTPAVSLIDPTQQALNSAIQGAAMRQQLLTANLANVNTPGYQRQDVDFHAQLRSAMATGETSAAFTPAVERGAQSADGNGIDLERESAELAKNALDQQALVSVARSRIDILTTAIGSGA
ncbi:flagellar basal body protein [Patulibacter brassicae]|jgi:flagellar basal-body rod protein FlgB|uniref:Flagellar basal body rod protein FlgB n=1 Tax=Patulibacter brassicae TaxID=1705717 RepID=A0ABU4VNL0_9ACTN|nr:flagellar basal body protein [Patulibacter brassicae]MDX8153209.1 flagellar basal body protein [Patulibacter brassicae]